MIGGYGNDWISGGTGDDGVIGDDGRIIVSRNATDLRRGAVRRGALLADNGDTKTFNGNMMDEAIATPGSIQQAVINPGGAAEEGGQPDAVQPGPELQRQLGRVHQRHEEDRRRPGPARRAQRRRHHLRRPRRRLAARRLGRRRDLRRRGARHRVHPGLRQHDPARRRAQRLRAPVQPGRRAALQPRRPERLALRPHQARRRVRALRRVRPAAAHLAQRRRQRQQDRRRRHWPGSSNFSTAEGSYVPGGDEPEGDRAAGVELAAGLERRQRPHLRRHRQRLAGRRHRPRQHVRRLRQRPAERRRRPGDERQPQRRARHAAELRGPRLRRRRPRRADRQHRRRPADRLGRRVQQLPRAVRAVRHGDRQPHAAAAARRVPLRAVGERRRRPDALRRHHGDPTLATATASPRASSASCARRTSPGRRRPARRPTRRPATSPAASATCCAPPTSTTARCRRSRPTAAPGRSPAARCRSPRRRLQADAVAVYQVGDALPSYFEVLATVQVIKPTARLEGQQLHHLRLPGGRRTSSSPASTSRPTSSRSATARRRAGACSRSRRCRAASRTTPGTTCCCSVNGLTATLMVDNASALQPLLQRRPSSTAGATG